MVTLTLQKLFSFIGSHLIIINTSASPIGVLPYWCYLLCQYIQDYSLLFFYMVQYIWIYVNMFNKHGLEFVRGDIWINLNCFHADILLDHHQLLRFFLCSIVYLWHFIKDHVSTGMGISVWIFSLVTLICVFVFMPRPCGIAS